MNDVHCLIGDSHISTHSYPGVAVLWLVDVQLAQTAGTGKASWRRGKGDLDLRGWAGLQVAAVSRSRLRSWHMQRPENKTSMARTRQDRWEEGQRGKGRPERMPSLLRGPGSFRTSTGHCFFIRFINGDTTPSPQGIASFELALCVCLTCCKGLSGVW